MDLLAAWILIFFTCWPWRPWLGWYTSLWTSRGCSLLRCGRPPSPSSSDKSTDTHWHPSSSGWRPGSPCRLLCIVLWTAECWGCSWTNRYPQSWCPGRWGATFCLGDFGESARATGRDCSISASIQYPEAWNQRMQQFPFPGIAKRLGLGVSSPT